MVRRLIRILCLMILAVLIIGMVFSQFWLTVKSLSFGTLHADPVGFELSFVYTRAPDVSFEVLTEFARKPADYKSNFPYWPQYRMLDFGPLAYTLHFVTVPWYVTILGWALWTLLVWRMTRRKNLPRKAFPVEPTAPRPETQTSSKQV